MKEYMEQYLRQHGVTNTRKLFKCLVHDDKNPSMSYKNNRVKCFSCGFSGDVLDLIQQQYGLSFLEAKKMGYKMFGTSQENFENITSKDINHIDFIDKLQRDHVDLMIKRLERQEIVLLKAGFEGLNNIFTQLIEEIMNKTGISEKWHHCIFIKNNYNI